MHPLAVTLVRAIAVAIGAVLLARPVCDALASATPGRRRVLIGASLLVTFTPPLLVAYAYASTVPSLPGSLASELFPLALLLVKHVPIAALALFLMPAPALSAQARHCRRLLPLRGSFAWHGSLRRQLVVGALVFVLAFQEFEWLTLNGASSWTVALFDAQAGGLNLAAALRAALVPVACEVVALGAIVWWLARGHWRTASEPARARRGAIVVAHATLALSVAAVLVVPIALIGLESLPGLVATIGSFRLGAEVTVAIWHAAVATALAMLLAHRWRSGGALLVTQLVLCLPGLFGSLVLALAMQGLFQLPVLRALYDTSLPLLLALTLLLLPRALALTWAVEILAPAPAFHLGRLLRGGTSHAQRRAGAELQWSLRGRATLVFALLLFSWTSFELVASAMLSPTGTTPVAVPLFNLMHYGHSAMLSAMVLVVVAEMLILAALSAMVCAIHRRWVARHA
jgi:hypothetical protein